MAHSEPWLPAAVGVVGSEALAVPQQLPPLRLAVLAFELPPSAVAQVLPLVAAAARLLAALEPVVDVGLLVGGAELLVVVAVVGVVIALPALVLVVRVVAEYYFVRGENDTSLIQDEISLPLPVFLSLAVRFPVSELPPCLCLAALSAQLVLVLWPLPVLVQA